tara:strand:- start:526 stop:822 length:297 start_codon:yes stop_codon:yes gene_type:complete
MSAYVYKITCNDETIEDCYVGVTKNIKQRIGQHKYNSKGGKEHHRPLYQRIKETGGWDNWKFDVIETISLDPILMKQREQYYIENLSSLNLYNSSYPK